MIAAATIVALLALAGHEGPASLVVGGVRLARCAGSEAWCGHLARPLDPTGRVAGTVSVYFEYYPARGPGPARGTLVAAEGGPGFATTASRSAYLALYEPLRADHDVVLMDYRGTGGSDAVDCEPLQHASRLAIDDITACGASLGDRAPLYGAADAADDLEAVLAALGAARVDLYGDSYGTFFAQVFAARHPQRLRSLTLDGAYPLDAPDIAWYPEYAPAMRAKFERACERSPRCNQIPGTSLEHIVPALDALRSRPYDARASDADGNDVRFRADGAALAIVLFGAAPAYATLRETDAAARAFAAGDRVPLERLMAEALSAVDSRDPSRDPALFSAGFAAAETCRDAPQIFDMALPPPLRAADRDRAIAARQAQAPDSFAPFSFDEYRAMPPDYAFIDQCVGWPAADPAHPPAYRAGPRFPDVPVLVLSGELDNMTSPADGAAAAAQFAHARHVLIANGLHVNALPQARSNCGAKLVRRFIAALDPGETGCAERVPPLRLAPPFARSADDVAAATALAGNDVDEPGLRVAAAALYTAGDLLGRIEANASGRGVGLRGGWFGARRDAHGVVHARLESVRWTADLPVSGTLDFHPGPDNGVARLHFRTRDGRAGEVTARWGPGGAEARARLEGRIGGRVLLGQAPAP